MGLPAAIASITALLMPSWSDGEHEHVGPRQQGLDVGSRAEEPDVDGEPGGLLSSRGRQVPSPASTSVQGEAALAQQRRPRRRGTVSLVRLEVGDAEHDR